MARFKAVKLLLLTLLTGAGLASLEPKQGSQRLDVPVPRVRASSASPGHDADTPLQIPPRGWWMVARRVAAQILADRVMAEAAGVTFYTLLALFPAIAALISLFGLVADPSQISKDLAAASGVVPSGGMQIISEQIHSLTSTPNKALGLGAILGLVVSIWSANAAMKALFDALNAVYEEQETRSFLRLTAISMVFTLGALLFMIVAMIAVVALPAALNFIGLGWTTALLLKLLRWPVLLATVAMFLALVYRYGPSRSRARWRWLSWGSVVASIVWVLASAAFSYYVANFGSYNKTYGSLGAVVGFMTWIWISMIIVLSGGELNAELEHQTECDTTAGADQPLGQRGAVKADQIVSA